MAKRQENKNQKRNGNYESEIGAPDEPVSYENIEDEQENEHLLKEWGINTDKLERFLSKLIKRIKDSGQE